VTYVLIDAANFIVRKYYIEILFFKNEFNGKNDDRKIS